MTGGAAPRSRPTFVLGVGAQKAGTTWLSRYLQNSPEFDRGYRKEYHVFDSLDLESEDWMRRRLVRLARDSADAVGRHEPGDAEVLHRLAMFVDLEFYFDWFAGLVRRGDGVRATGDMTPDYAMLSAERMTSIAAGFDARGLDTVAVFLMRDPVDRIWSHIRMKARARPDAFTRSPEDELHAEHADERYARRTRYHETLGALGTAFDDERVHVGLYETLFTDDRQVHAISRVVGITPRKPRLRRTSNSSPRLVAELPESIARPVAEHYAETYREVARLRPDLDLERWWPRSRWVL
ncbi:MAG: hypothetical protein JWN84_4603 [Nocardioides sp.]|jgi:hypothetical protein|nr:hypothetical protein [Nocardioides sp.]